MPRRCTRRSDLTSGLSAHVKYIFEVAVGESANDVFYAQYLLRFYQEHLSHQQLESLRTKVFLHDLKRE